MGSFLDALEKTLYGLLLPICVFAFAEGVVWWAELVHSWFPSLTPTILVTVVFILPPYFIFSFILNYLMSD